MKKRLLSLLLCLVAVLTLLPLPALADGGHSHCICGGDVTAGDHTGHTDVTYQPWNGTSGITYANGAAYVYLTGNATLSGHLTVDGKTLYLCLNGKTLASNGTAKIQVKNGGLLSALRQLQGAALYFLVKRKPLAAHPHSRRRGRVPPCGASIPGPDLQPVYCLYPPHLRRSRRHTPPGRAARKRGYQLLHRVGGGPFAV